MQNNRNDSSKGPIVEQAVSSPSEPQFEAAKAPRRTLRPEADYGSFGPILNRMLMEQMAPSEVWQPLAFLQPLRSSARLEVPQHVWSEARRALTRPFIRNWSIITVRRNDEHYNTTRTNERGEG